jgi:signal transduction histidine kinase
MRRSPPGPPRDGNGGRWRLLAWHRAGSLEALVEQTRRRNLELSGGLLLLILGTAAALVRYSRLAQKLAETRINFVAGVSHELRTPLTVIRTASFNLRGKLSHKPDQVERYGKLIQRESERLTALVEQVLLFASAKSGSLLGTVAPVCVAELVEQCVKSVRAHAPAELIIETHLPPDLSKLLADEIALAHALENLIDNAAKHGANPEMWISVCAREVEERGTKFVELSIIDRGPGIPAEEQGSIFEPFYRGRRAMEDQVRGTGLGLDLVKKIAEAHGGSVRVISVPWVHTEFILRLPAAHGSNLTPTSRTTEAEHEFAHPVD